MANPADNDPGFFAEPGLFYFEGLAVQIVIPTGGPQSTGAGQLDFSKPGNSAFEPSTGPFV